MKTSLAVLAFLASLPLMVFADSGAERETALAKNLAVEIDAQRKVRSNASIHNRLATKPLSSFSSASQQKPTEKTTGKVFISTRSESKKQRSKSFAKKASTPTLRSQSPEKSKSAFGFSFYTASSILNFDLDGDGYYSDFTINFDADFENGSADVYAVIYYSRDGGDWTELAETEVFSIYSNNSSDQYSLSTTLNYGFPTSNYDILIDLYESGIDGIVATVSSDDLDALYALPLEDEEHEVIDNSSQISFVSTDLFGDGDGDGFYTDLTLEYDIDAQYSGDLVYAEVILTNTQEGWQQRVFSDDFVLENSTEFVDLTFNSGYPAGWYDVKINLINVFTNELIADAGREFSSLRSLPIESTNNDKFYDSTVTSDVDVHVSGGGSLGWGILFLSALGFIRVRYVG